MFFTILIFITALLFIPYSILMLLYKKWYGYLKPYIPDLLFAPKTFFSIVIPARNEEENIGNCLQAICSQNYPKHLFEVIVIDDYSTDNTAKIIRQFGKANNNIKLISLQQELNGKKLNAYKKKAIEIAIGKALGDWIITTDADCMAQQNWLFNFDNYIQQNNVLMVAAPVSFLNDKTILSQFQYIDFMALQAATAATVSAGKHTLCNGANLTYNKNAFYKVEGFKGIDNIASGDDMLLMNKIKKQFVNSIGYLYNKESIVHTHTMPTWKSFINQRIRWASKADKYEDKTLLPVLVMVYWFNVNCFLLMMLSVISLKSLVAAICFILLKTIVEWLFLNPATKFFGAVNFLNFLFLQPLHITYIVVAGWLGKFGSYKWKERKVQ